MPPSMSRIIWIKVSKTYILYKILEESEIRVVIFSTVGPGASARAINRPPMPSAGSREMARIRMPIAPSQWLKERQNWIAFGATDKSEITVAPVVVNPEIDSKSASA